jgi:folate-binding protein YgfZ
MSLKQLLDTYQHRQFDLSGLGLLKINGGDSTRFLQGQLSCNVNAIASGSGVMGAHCNSQGRIISLFYAAKIHDDFYLVMPKNLLPAAMAALKKYAPFFKSELTDASDSYHIIGTLSSTEHASADAQITLPASSNRKILLISAEEYSTTNTETQHEWQMLDILEGIPTIYAETSAKFLPHDINLPTLNAISFTKGCFTGQEIIARMHYRGKPKKHLYLGFSTGILAAGDELYHAETPVAEVIDCSKNVYNDRYALLFTADEATVKQQQLRSKQGNIIEPQLSE